MAKKKLNKKQKERLEKEEASASKVLRTRKDKLAKDVPTTFKWNAYDAAVADILIENERENPQKLMKLFDQYQQRLSKFAFWYLLRVCWLRYPSETHSDLWGKYFASSRPQRNKSLMRPSEAQKLRLLPKKIPVAYSKKEKWRIHYNLLSDDDTLDLIKSPVEFGEVEKHNVIALFHGKRKIEGIDEETGEPIFGEKIAPDEIIVLNPEHVTVLASAQKE